MNLNAIFDIISYPTNMFVAQSTIAYFMNHKEIVELLPILL